MSNGNGALGPNTLDAFGHGGAYSVSGVANSNGNAAAPPPPRCLDIFTVDSVAAANNGTHLNMNQRRNFAASPMPQLGSGSQQSHRRRGSAAAANAYEPPSYFAATANSRKQSDGPGLEVITANGSTPKVRKGKNSFGGK